MGPRLLLSVLIAGGVAVNPSLRERIKPYVWPYAEPHVRLVLDPVYEWSARSRVQEIARWMEAELSRGGSLPADDRLLGEQLRARYYGADGALDPWGGPLFLLRGGDGARIASAGRDRVRGTSDDILSSPLPTSRK